MAQNRVGFGVVYINNLDKDTQGTLPKEAIVSTAELQANKVALSHIKTSNEQIWTIVSDSHHPLPQETQVYCASVRAAVQRSSKAAAPTGFDQRESGSRTVGT